MKKLISALLALSLCALLLVPAALAEDGFHAGLTVDRSGESSGTITVTVTNSAILAEKKPTLTVPCSFSPAKVTLNGTEVASYLSNGLVTFQVAAGGTYTITKDQPSVELEPTVTPTPTPSPTPTQTTTPKPAPTPAPTIEVETVEKEDGTVVTTETDLETGVITQTAVAADGTEAVAVIQPDGTVTATVTLPDTVEQAVVTVPVQEPTATTVAVIVGADGTRQVIPQSVASQDGLTVALTGSAQLELVDNAKHFTDVPEEDWYTESVAFVSARELMVGTDVELFSPTEPASRAMAMTILAKYSGVDTSGGELWYSVSVQWAMENGVSDGTDPEATITREQLACMLYRYAGSPDTAGTVEQFTDRELIDDWATEAMCWCVEQGILCGRGNGVLAPTEQASRAEAAVMLEQFVKWSVQ